MVPCQVPSGIAFSMSFNNAAHDSLERYRREYARSPSAAARRVEEAVLGRYVGVSGYTTVEQGKQLAGYLELPRGARVLDIGAGRGWPGSHLAVSSGCRLVATDVPVEALVAARDYVEIGSEPGQARLVSADGRALPFRPGTFEAVVHADVFC